MNKQEFLDRLRSSLGGLPQSDIEERISFYTEMIDDRMEEGLTEEQSVSELGSVEDIVMQIMSEIPLTKLVKEKVKPSRALRAWEIVLLIIGSPIWLSLLIGLVVIILSLYAVIWSVIVSLWAVEASLVIVSVAGILGVAIVVLQGSILSGAVLLGAVSVCAGLSVFGAFGCIYATKGVLILTKSAVLRLKTCFIRKGGAK